MVRITADQALTVDTCGATRLLIPSSLVGLIVSSAAGSDLLGWIAAAVTIAVLIAVQRIRGAGAACAIRQPEGATHPVASPTEPASTPTSPS